MRILYTFNVNCRHIIFIKITVSSLKTFEKFGKVSKLEFSVRFPFFTVIIKWKHLVRVVARNWLYNINKLFITIQKLRYSTNSSQTTLYNVWSLWSFGVTALRFFVCIEMHCFRQLSCPPPPKMDLPNLTHITWVLHPSVYLLESSDTLNLQSS